MLKTLFAKGQIARSSFGVSRNGGRDACDPLVKGGERIEDSG